MVVIPEETHTERSWSLKEDTVFTHIDSHASGVENNVLKQACDTELNIFNLS